MRRLAIALMLFVAPVVFAAEQSDFYVVPIAGHVTGLNGSNWMTDISIQNFQAEPLTVQFVVIESGEAMPDNVTPLDSAIGSQITVPANGTRILRDVMNGHRGMSQSLGAVMLGADRPFAVSSRSYVMNANGGTIGQSVMPVRDFLDNTLGDTNLVDASAYVAGLTSNAHYRTNLGFVAGTTNGFQLEVTIRGADGSLLGTHVFNVPPRSFEHVQFSSSVITSQSFDEASAIYRIVSGDGAVVPYASVIDNLSSAGFYISGQFPKNAPLGGSAFRRMFSLALTK